MKVRRGRKAVHVAVATALSVAGVVVLTEGTVRAASIQDPPTRLYVGAFGSSYQLLPVPYIVPVPVGLITFDGSDDPVSGDTRSVVVDTADGVGGCDIAAPDYSRGACTRVVLNVIHGRIWMGLTTEEFREDGEGDPNPADPAFMYDTGAMLDAFGGGDSDDDPNLPAGYGQLELLGTEQELNDTLERLVYVPDEDYHYTDADPEERLFISVVPGDGTASVQHSVEIRVLDDNGWPTIDGPTADKTAEPEVPLVISNEFEVGDEDNDEIIDGAQADPPETEEPLKDGVYDEMLLVGYLDCGGDATVDGLTGFHYQGGAFDTTAGDLADLVTEYFEDRDTEDGNLAEISQAVDLVTQALEAIEPGITTIPLSNNDPLEFQSVFAGIADDIEDLQYAIDEITFLHDAAGASCNLLTFVSDLGNSGLPVQYFGDPPDGFEVPFIGFAWNEFDITVGELEELDVSWDQATYYVNEGDPGDPFLAIEPTISFDPTTHPEFGFYWEATPGTADGPPSGDYQGAQNGNIDVLANATGWTMDSMSVAHDNDVEGDEQFTIQITPPDDPPNTPSDEPAGWDVVSNLSTITVVIIDDDDPAKSVSVADASLAEGDGPGTTNMTFPLTLSAPADGTESVEVTLTPGSATTPADYGPPITTTVTFAAGQETATVDVPIVGDTFDESDHSFTLSLGSPQNVTIGTGTATGTILDDDATRTVSIADFSIGEGNSGQTAMTFTLSISPAAKGTESVTVTSGPGAVDPATAVTDYEPLLDELVEFGDGDTTATVTVMVAGDTDIEPNETFELTLGDPVLATLGDGTATGTIINDDGVPDASINDVSLAEGDAGSTAFQFTVTLSDPSVGTSTVQVATATGTAQSGTDFTAVAETLTFLDGESTQTVDVDVTGEFAPELTESFFVNLTNPIGMVILDSQGVGTIVNDDVEVTIAPSQTIPEGSAGTVELAISPIDHPGFTVTVSTADGSATQPADYAALTAQPVNVPPGATTATVELTTAPDFIVEGPHDFTVTVAAPAVQQPSYTVRIGAGAGTSTVTIDDDDQPSVVSIDDVTVTEGLPGNVTLEMTNPTGRFCQVAITSVNGTAVAVSDFVAYLANTFDLNGVATALIPAGHLDDDEVEVDETFTVTVALTPASDVDCQLPDNSVTITIVSDDVASVVSIDDSSITEGLLGDATISMTNPAGRFCEVTVTSANGTAGALDFAPIADPGFALNGVGSAPFALNAVDDGDVEVTETYTLTIALTGASDAECQLGDDEATILLVDNDSPPDVDPPTVTVEQGSGQNDPTAVASIEFDVEFSEPVIGFDATVLDFTGSTTTGTLAGSISGAGPAYVVTVTGMIGSGLVVLSVPAGSVTDAVPLDNTDSVSIDNEVTYDIDGPTVTVAPAATQETPTTDTTIVFDVEFSEPVTGFVTGDVTIAGSALPTSHVVTPVDADSYQVAVSGMSLAGTVTVQVPVAAADDLAGNPNTISNVALVNFLLPVDEPDPDPPTVVVSPGPVQANPTTQSPIVFTIQFSEAVTGFVTGDVTIGGTASAGTTQVVTSIDADTYEVAVSLMTIGGTITATVPAAVAIDLATNPNTASNTSTIQFNLAPGPLTLNLPSNITQNNDPGQAGAVVNYPNVTASGGIPPIAVVCDLASGAFYSLGTTTVNCTATDAEGGQQEAVTTGSFTITVVDVEPPVIADLPDLTRQTTGSTPVVVTFPLPAATDNSGVPPTVVCAQGSGATFNLGVTTVTCTATDGAGLTASSSFTITVVSDPNSGGVAPGDGQLPATGSSPDRILMLATLLLALGAMFVEIDRRRRRPV